MINTVIFDIGMVLIVYDWKEHLKNIFHEEALCERLYDAFYGHGVWDELDRGTLSKEELIAEIVKYAGGYEAEIRHYFDRIGEALIQYEHAKPWIKSLKEHGSKVYYLSNYSPLVIDQNRECLDFIPMMDGGLFSYEIQKIKPEREMYQYLCEKYSINPAEAVFVDDKPENVKAAKEFGLNAIRFVNPNQTKKELDDLLGYVV